MNLAAQTVGRSQRALLSCGLNVVRPCVLKGVQFSSSSLCQSKDTKSSSSIKKATTPVGRLDTKIESDKETLQPPKDTDPYAPFPENKNPDTGEIGGPKGPEPTRYGDWERKGRVIDF